MSNRRHQPANDLGALGAFDVCIRHAVYSFLPQPDIVSLGLACRGLQSEATGFISKVFLDSHDFIEAPRTAISLVDSCQLSQLPAPPHLMKPPQARRLEFPQAKSLRLRVNPDAPLFSKKRMQDLVGSLWRWMPRLRELEVQLREAEPQHGAPLLQCLAAATQMDCPLASLRLDLQVSPSLRAWDSLACRLSRLTTLILHMPLSHALLGRLSALTALTSLEFTAVGRGRRGDSAELRSALASLGSLTALRQLKADGPSWLGFREGVGAALQGMGALTALELPGHEGVLLPSQLLQRLQVLSLNSVGNASPLELPALTRLSCSMALLFEEGVKVLHCPALVHLSQHGECRLPALAPLEALGALTKLDLMSVSDDTDGLHSLGCLAALTRLQELRIAAEACPPAGLLAAALCKMGTGLQASANSSHPANAPDMATSPAFGAPSGAAAAAAAAAAVNRSRHAHALSPAAPAACSSAPPSQHTSSAPSPSFTRPLPSSAAASGPCTSNPTSATASAPCTSPHLPPCSAGACLRSLDLIGFSADRVVLPNGGISVAASSLSWLAALPQLQHLALTASSLPLAALPPSLTSLHVSGADPRFFGAERPPPPAPNPPTLAVHPSNRGSSQDQHLVQEQYAMAAALKGPRDIDGGMKNVSGGAVHVSLDPQRMHPLTSTGAYRFPPPQQPPPGLRLRSLSLLAGDVSSYIDSAFVAGGTGELSRQGAELGGGALLGCRCGCSSSNGILSRASELLLGGTLTQLAFTPAAVRSQASGPPDTPAPDCMPDADPPAGPGSSIGQAAVCGNRGCGGKGETGGGADGDGVGDTVGAINAPAAAPPTCSWATEGALLAAACGATLHSLELHPPGPVANAFGPVVDPNSCEAMSWSLDCVPLSASMLCTLPALRSLSFGPRNAAYNRCAVDVLAPRRLEALSALTQLAEVSFGEGCGPLGWSHLGEAYPLHLQHLAAADRAVALRWAQAALAGHTQGA